MKKKKTKTKTKQKQKQTKTKANKQTNKLHICEFSEKVN